MAENTIKIKGRFKSVNLTNTTLQIIIYPEDGLKRAVELQGIEHGEKVEIIVRKQGF